MARAVLCLLAVIVFISVSANGGAAVTEPVSGESIISADCQIKLRGKNQLKVDGPHTTKDDDFRTSDQGLQEARLVCSTVPAGHQVPISVNRTWITPGHTSGFKGVRVLTSDPSCQRATTGQTYVFGLVNFCGSYELTFSLVDIAGLHVHAPITTGVDNALAWGLSAVLIGRNVRARIDHARVTRNSVMSVFAVKDAASLILGRDVVMTYNRGVWGSCLHAMGSSSVVVNGSQLSHNFAHNSGGCVTARDQSTVLITGRAQISYCESRVWGGALQADTSAHLTVAGGSIIHNNKAQYGGAAACKSTAVVHVKGPHTTMHSNTATAGGGGVGAQGFATILSTDGAIWRNNSAQSGGAAAGQNNVNITFDSNTLAVENHAYYGGVAAIADMGFIVFKGNTTLMHNRASWRGGGAYGGAAAAQGLSTLYFYKVNVIGNTALCGGVSALQNQGHMKAYEGSLFSGNVAEQGGVVCAMELSDVLFNGSIAVNNSASGLKSQGGVVSLETKTEAIVAGNTIMANNSAANGGAVALQSDSTLRLEGACVLENNTATVDGGAVLLGPGTSLNISLGDPNSAITSPGPRISGNRAGNKGGGVVFKGDGSRLDAVLLKVATGNNAKFDPDISTPLQRIDIQSDRFVRLASRRNRNETLTIRVKLIGHLGVASGGVRVQANLKDYREAGVLGEAATSNISGDAELRDVKLRVKPGNYTVLISAPDAKDIAPAMVNVAVRTCTIGETTNLLGDSCDTCGPGTYSLDPANYTCDSCPETAKCQGGAQIVPTVGYWSSSHMSPQIHPCPNPAACSGDRRTLLACDVVPSNTSANPMRPGDASSFAFRCRTGAIIAIPKSGSGSGRSIQPKRGMLSSMEREGTVYLTQADTRELLCATGYGGTLCGNCQPGYGQASAFTCHPCLPRRTAAVLYAAAFIAALLMVRLLTWLTITDNNASAAAAAAAATAAAAAGPSQAGKAAAAVAAAAAKPVSSKGKDPSAHTSGSTNDAGPGRRWREYVPGFIVCCGSNNGANDTDVTLCMEGSGSVPPTPKAVQRPSASTGALKPFQSGVSAQSVAAAGPLASASSTPAPGGASGVTSGSYLARASDIFRVFVLYIQYMVIIANLRVSWPVTISYPSKALTWLYSVGSSQALALECLYDVHGWNIPPDIQRQLVYIVMPLAVFLVLWLIELLVRCLILLLPSGLACCCNRATRRRGISSGHTSSRRKTVFAHFGTVTLVLFMVTIFFFLPALVRSGLGFFACIPLDDPKATPYAWAGLAPGSYWVAGPNQPCWSGWHAKWAWSFGVPLVALLCVVIPISIAALVYWNRGRLDSPELKRHFGFIYWQYKPNRAAWEAVVIGQTTMLCVVAVFGLALGPNYQTLTMAAFCAVNIVMLQAFEPYKHRQQHRVQLFAFTCIFVMCFAALSFIPSYDGKVPPEGYKIAMGAAVLTLNIVFICWGLWQLWLCLVDEFSSFWNSLGSKVSVVRRKVRIFCRRQRT